MQGSGCRDQGAGFRVQGSATWEPNSKAVVMWTMFMVLPLAYEVRSGFRVQGSGFRVQGSGFRVQGAGYKVQGSEFVLSLCCTPHDATHHLPCFESRIQP